MIKALNGRINKMTNQEKNQTLQTLNEISVLIADLTDKYENELCMDAKKQYAKVFSFIGRADEGLNNVAYQLFYKGSK